MADNEIGSLHYDIGADDTQLGKALDRSDKKVKGFGGTLNKFGDNLQAGFRDAAKVLAVTGAALTLYAKNATDFTVDFVKSSKTLGVQIGVSTKEASRLVAALGRMGIEAQDASQIFGIFSKNIVASTEKSKDNNLAFQKLRLQVEDTKRSIAATTKEIKDNGDKSGELDLKLRILKNTLADQQNQLDKNADSFQKLGVSTVDATGKQKDFETILFEVADRFQEMPDGVDKTAIALDLFGRSGKSMIKVLNLGSEGIRDLEEQADRLGLTLTSETIGAVNDLVMSQKELKARTDALKIAVGTATAPVLTKFNDALIDITDSLLKADGPIKDMTTNFLAFGGPVASGAAGIAGFLGNISSITPKIAGFLARLGLVGVVIGAVVGAIYLLVQAFGGWDKAMKAVNEGMKFLNDMGKSIAATWNAEFLPVIRAIWNALATALGPAVKVLWQALKELWATIQKELGPALAELWKAFMELWKIIAPVMIPIMKAQAVVIGGVLLAAISALIAILYVVAKVFTFVISVVSKVIKAYADYSNWSLRVANTVASVVRTIGNWFGRLPGYVSDAINRATSYFRNFPQRILGAVGKLGSLLFNTGRQMIQGLINGIQTKVGEVVNILANLGKKAAEAIANVLGIKSPSKVFIGIGKDVTAGFVQGITSGTDAAMKAMDNLSNAVITPTIAASPMRAGAPNVGAGNTTSHRYGDTNITIGEINDRQDADYLLNRVDKNQRYQLRGVSPK